MSANGKSGGQLSQTLETAINSFCSELRPANFRAVHQAVLKIGGLQRQIVINMLAIGDHLSKLRTEIGPKKFNQFMSEVLPLLGISRSTGYRWLGFAENLPPLFPNPLIRQHLMTLTDGKGIITRSQQNPDDPDAYDVVLTVAAGAALKKVPPAPKDQQDSAKCEEWVRRFIKVMSQARTEARSSSPGTGSQKIAKERLAIIRRFKRFAGRYGVQTAEDLCGLLDKMLTSIAEEEESNLGPLHTPAFVAAAVSSNAVNHSRGVV